MYLWWIDTATWILPAGSCLLCLVNEHMSCKGAGGFSADWKHHAEFKMNKIYLMLWSAHNARLKSSQEELYELDQYSLIEQSVVKSKCTQMCFLDCTL